MPGPIIGGKAKAKKMASANSQQTQDNIPLKLAKEAVATYQSERDALEQMREQFETDYPDAHAFLQDIKQQEDLVTDAIDTAKPLVAKLKKSVGDFIAKRKWTTPRYDDDAFTELIGQLEDGDTIVALIKQGHVKKVVLDKGATAWFVQHPDTAEVYGDAWRDKEEMTTAVTTPKLR